MEKLRYSITGIEISKEKRKLAKKITKSKILNVNLMNENIDIKNFDAIILFHVLEHLSYEDFQRALKNTFEILGNGGIYRLVVPDLEHYVQNYMNSTSPDSAGQFLLDTYLGREKRNRGLKGMILEYFGNSHHLWMWDYKSIENELSKVGFVDIRRAVFSDSEDKMFESVEDEGRWTDCLGVESFKP